MVSNAVSHEFARKLTSEDVTVAEWSFLRALYDVDALSPSILAEKMGMTKGAISKLADRLMVKGLVMRSDDFVDKRTHRLSLTISGRGKVPALAALADKNDDECFGVLSEDERETLDHILKTLVERQVLTNTPVD